MATIYGPQIWSAGTFAVATSDTGDANYPNTVERARVETRDGLGPGGERILDTYQASPNYSVGSHVEAGFGPASGYWDSRGGDGTGVYYEGDFFFDSNAEADSGDFSYAFSIGVRRASPLSYQEVFNVRVALTEGVMYCSMNGVEIGTGFGTVSADNQWHTIKALVLPGDGFVPHTEAVITIWLDGVQVYNNTTSSLFVPTSFGQPAYHLNYLAHGFYGLLPTTNFQIYDTDAAVVVPPMQRSGYVLFSNDIVEKQAETRYTKSYLMMLAADPPASTPPASLTLTQITGNLYDQQGNAITSGRLYITPRQAIIVGNYLVAAKTVTYDITGAISLNLAASSGILYDVEYDPDPADTDTPRSMKSGFFRDVWDIPASGPVDITTL